MRQISCAITAKSLISSSQSNFSPAGSLLSTLMLLYNFTSLTHTVEFSQSPFQSRASPPTSLFPSYPPFLMAPANLIRASSESYTKSPSSHKLPAFLYNTNVCLHPLGNKLKTTNLNAFHCLFYITVSLVISGSRNPYFVCNTSSFLILYEKKNKKNQKTMQAPSMHAQGSLMHIQTSVTCCYAPIFGQTVRYIQNGNFKVKFTIEIELC